jgi:regulator of RNase E activity RraA
MRQTFSNMAIATLSPADFEQIRRLDTCTASNAIERFNVRLRNEGFASGAIRCRFPHLPPMLGYAVTGRVRTSSPPMTGRCYFDRIDFWRHVTEIPSPRVIVLEDVDHLPGSGAMVGDIHAHIGLALGCIGHITNGAVRDLPAVEAAGFQLFSGRVAPSHAYAHIIEFGEPVMIGGLKICPGDLIHGDKHGIQSIPLSIASQIPKMASEIAAQEQELIAWCRSNQFSLEELAAKMSSVSAECVSNTYHPGSIDDKPTGEKR